jgi:polar amino acid transport system permease protein
MDELIGLLAWGPDGWGDEIADGLKVTALLALTTAPVGLVFGFLLALGRRSDNPALKIPSTVFTTIFKGLPELISLFMVFYGVPLLVQWVVQFVAPEARVEMSPFVAGVMALGAVSASFASEVFMSALAGVQKGQVEAANALGLRRLAVMWKIVIPQVIRLALPGLGNLWLVLLKDTALVAVIALPDLLRETQIAVGATREPFFFFSVAMLIYFTLSMLSSSLLSLIERRYSRGYASS